MIILIKRCLLIGRYRLEFLFQYYSTVDILLLNISARNFFSSFRDRSYFDHNMCIKLDNR